jgi:hypothetical protein
MTSIRHNPSVVSEPSNASDQGTIESDESPGESSGGSGNEALAGSENASNDSDGRNSDTSSRKKARISYTKSLKIRVLSYCLFYYMANSHY